MKIKITKEIKVVLLKALQNGYLDTNLLPGLIDEIDLSKLTTEELIQRVEKIRELSQEPK
ncbi:MAG TPA: hypothetical protein VFC41_09260 [Anaerovoracaceae bacterium]|nr:hypothetical protein [Anaerovoracaceae bacterium]